MKDIKYFVVVHKANESLEEAIDIYNKEHDNTLRLLILVHKKHSQSSVKKEKKNIVLSCNFNNEGHLAKALLPYKDHIVGMSAYGEDGVRSMRKIIPHVPYIPTPTVQSLTWATNKISMRTLFRVMDASITPRFLVANDDSEETIQKIIKKVGLPLVVKPSGLAASLLVTKCYHEEEVRKALKKVFKKIKQIQKEKNKKDQIIEILVEQFMEGEMYSIDAYISRKGTIYFCPIVHVKTGKQIGFDDFFGYQRITPTILSEKNILAAQEVAAKSIKAINLRSSTAHVELMRTEEGWKVIELGARIGGFRHAMYDLSFGINHRFNDVLVHMGKKPVIPKKVKGYTAALKFYPKKEGTLEKIKGVNKIKKLSSIHKVLPYKKAGDYCRFAKHGDKSVIDVVLFNKKRPELLADIRRLEKTLEIIVK